MTKPKIEWFRFGVPGTSYRKKRVGRVVTLQIEEVYPHSPEVEDVARFAASHEDCELYAVDNYGSQTVHMSGWRDATPEETKKFNQWAAVERDKRAEMKEAELERARQILREAGEL